MTGNLNFVPINWLPQRKQMNIAKMLQGGLHEITEFAEKKTWFGKATINLEKQNLIGKFILHHKH